MPILLQPGLAAIIEQGSIKRVLPFVEKFNIWCRNKDVAYFPSWVSYSGVKNSPEPDIVEVVIQAKARMMLGYSDSGELVIDYDGQTVRFQVLLEYGTLDVYINAIPISEQEHIPLKAEGMAGYVPKGSRIEIVQLESRIDWHSYF